MRLKTDLNTLSGKKRISIFYGMAFLIPAVLMLGICILMRITPFGDGSFLIADMQKQYADFFAYYKTIFRGENNIFYTFSKCLGGDMIGLFTYYLTSPFNLLFLFIKTGWIPAGITILILLKLGCCGISMAYYLNQRFSRRESPEIWVFSTSYAMMGYLMTNSFNIMWLDVLIWFPVVLFGIEKILRNKKPYTYIGSLFMVLLCNYYIGYMVCIFCVFYLIYRLVVLGKKEGLFRKLWVFFYSSLLAAGLGAILLVPTLFTLTGSQKDAKDLGLGITLPNLNPVRVLSKLFTMAFSEHELMNGMPNIFCGLLMFVLTVLFFFHKKIPVRERLMSGILMGIVMGSFCRAEVDFVWHAFMEPSGYHYRYAFLFSFLMIVYSYQGLIQMKEGLDTKRFLYAGGTFLLLFLLIFRHRYEYLNVVKALPDLCMIFAILLMLFFITKEMSKGQAYRKWFLLLAVIQFLNLSVNGTFTYRKLRNTFYSTASEYRIADSRVAYSTLNSVRRMDDGFYRMENLTPKGVNDAMHYSYAGLTHYSSNEKNFVLSFLEKVGLNYSGLYVEYGTGTTQTVDSLLGVKYLFGTEYLLETQGGINKPYPPVYHDRNGLVFYENPYVLPLGFLAEEGVRQVDMEEKDPFMLQDAMYGGAAGESGKIFKETVIQKIDRVNCTEEKENNLSCFRRIEEDQPVSMTYEMETEADGRVYAYITAQEMTQPAEVYLNGEFLCGYLNRSNWKILNLGEYKKGEKLLFTIQTSADTLMIENAYFATEDRIVLEEEYDKIMEAPVLVTRKSSSHLVAEAENTQEKVLVFSIPYETNWKITVDGERVKPEKVYDTFLAVDLKEGRHTIELYYVPKGFFVGMAISIVCIGIVTGMFVREKRKRSKFTVLEGEG